MLCYVLCCVKCYAHTPNHDVLEIAVDFPSCHFPTEKVDSKPSNFAVEKIEVLSPCIYSPPIKLSLGKLKLSIPFGNGLVVIIVYLIFQINVLFFVVSTKC